MSLSLHFSAQSWYDILSDYWHQQKVVKRVSQRGGEGRGLVPPSGFLSVLNWPLTNEHLLESQTGISAIIQGHGAIKSEEFYITLTYVALNNKIWLLNEFLLLRLYHEGVTCSSFWSSGPYQFHVIIRNEEMNTVLL